GCERATDRWRLPFSSDVRDAVGEPQPPDARDVPGIPPQVDRVEDGSRHARLGDRALDAIAFPPSERIFAKPEHADLLDLGKACQHAQLREHANVTAP